MGFPVGVVSQRHISQRCCAIMGASASGRLRIASAVGWMSSDALSASARGWTGLESSALAELRMVANSEPSAAARCACLALKHFAGASYNALTEAGGPFTPQFLHPRHPIGASRAWSEVCPFCRDWHGVAHSAGRLPGLMRRTAGRRHSGWSDQGFLRAFTRRGGGGIFRPFHRGPPKRPPRTRIFEIALLISGAISCSVYL